MTSPAHLRVTPVGLRGLAQRCVALADGVAPTLPVVSVSTWQTSGAAVSTVNAGVSETAMSLRGRMTANAGKLNTAAHDYEAVDDHSAAKLTGSFPPTVPRSSGADGGAGGLGIPG